ncbi:hypothetical protein RB653_002047 [Dictyostelium firmibasis]|uniref:Choline transporter-like protein n=1 Tax=Dictyostelium firmibasis TaxID=79012 RepID=A0AAN7TPZ5_9MYCE
MGIEDNPSQQPNTGSPYGQQQPLQPQQPQYNPYGQQQQHPPQQYNPYGQQNYGYEPQYQPTYQQQPPQPQYYGQTSMPLPPQQHPHPQADLNKPNDRESLIGGGGIPPNNNQTMVGSYNEGEAKFTPPKYQDIWFTILFALNFVLLIVVSASAFAKDSYYVDYSYDDTSSGSFGFLFAILPFTIVFSLFYIWAWLKLAANHAESLIKYSFIGAIGMIVGYCIYFFVTGFIYLGIIFAVMAFFIILFYISCRGRIAFTATLLSNAVAIIKEYPSAIRAGYISVFINFIWFIIWGSAFVRVNIVYTGAIQTCINVYLVFTLYWVFHVIKNTLHTTVSGLLATWYFCSGPNGVGMPHNPTLGSARRALTTSFGSICLGSLIISVIETLRYLSQMMINNRNVFVKIIGYILNFILSILSSIVQFFNTYAFTHVAIYGKSFCDSAKSTFTMFETRLGSTIINDNFVGTTIAIGGLVASLLLSILGALISIPFGMSPYGGALALFIGYLVIITNLEVVYSSTISLFVCFVMEPQVLAQTKPQLYQLYSSTYHLR